MLQHDQNLQEDVPAAQVRVTAEEFARAVARYQARREEAAQHLEGTVTIGEAVRELGLEATPEELLQEVRAARTQQARQGKARRGSGLAWAGASVLALLFLGLTTLNLRHPPTAVSIPVAAPVPAAPAETTIAAPPGTVVQDAGGRESILRTLGEVKDGVPVQSALSATPDGVSIANFSSMGTAWHLIKHDGHLYIRGWMAAMSPAAMKTGPVEIYDMKAGVASGATPKPVTLRLDRLRVLSALSNDEMISAKGVVPDKHFAEPWR
ncbi:MAG: hypothetical protein JO250_00695 [Armatimonadetes bacterium]|nr:hypothetical protein [Armatimonadota bacterium]